MKLIGVTITIILVSLLVLLVLRNHLGSLFSPDIDPSSIKLEASLPNRITINETEVSPKDISPSSIILAANLSNQISIAETKVPPKDNSKFRLASYYSNHMVLQKEPLSSVIWGYGEVGAEIKIQIDVSSKFYSTNVTSSGIWNVSLGLQRASGPHTISFFHKTTKNVQNKIILTDVFFGDVWFCSGQSNMEFPIKKMENREAILNESKEFPNVRYFQVKESYDQNPRTDLQNYPMSWSSSIKSVQPLNQFSALCWLYGKHLYESLGRPIGLILVAQLATPIELWSTHESLKRCIADDDEARNESWLRASLLWNSRVHPFTRMVIKGVIWYQGEANTDIHPDIYNCTFPNMIKDWREKWYEATGRRTQQLFPFGFVQLAGLGNSEIFSWLRWHQTADYGYVPNDKMKNTFMCSAMDLPDNQLPQTNVHSPDKTTVARRLSWAALNQVYGLIQYPRKGPTVIQNRIKYSENGTVRLEFDRDVELRNTTGFEYCCLQPSGSCGRKNDSDDWKPVYKVQQDSSKVLLLSVSCRPSVLLYAWSSLPCLYKKCSIYSADTFQLPATIWRWEM